MTNIFGLRERKKAQLRLDLLSALLKALKTTPFEAIKVKELCDQVSISEVTFFKYFEKKEELLQYYMMVWNYKRALGFLKEKRPQGIDGIYRLFDDIASTDNVQHIMNTIVGYVTKLTERPQVVELSDCEKWLINKKLQTDTPESLNNQLAHNLKEAIDAGQLPSDIDIDKYLLLLATIYYGGPIVSHLTEGNLKAIYKEQLDLILG